MASGRLSPGLSRNRLPPLIIKTKHKHKYPSKIDGPATYSKYYKILDNCVNHSYAKKCKAKGKNKWKMKMKSRGKEKKWTFLSFFLSFFFCILSWEEECFQLTGKRGRYSLQFWFFFFFFFFFNFKAKRVKEFSTWGTDRDLFVGDKGSLPPMLGQWPWRPWCWV